MKKLPVIFVGHGSPMNAIEDNRFSRTWAETGQALPRPSGILVISAHWETNGVRVTASDKPETIHDFYGFPGELYEIEYPAPGSPELAEKVQQLLKPERSIADNDWGLDHGSWSVLCHMYKNADIPVIQLSLNRNKPPEFHYNLGKHLKSLRDQGILIIGSGNIVHNLRMMVWQETAYDWAVKFDRQINHLIETGAHDRLIDYKKLPDSGLAVPTNEHYLPLLYILGATESDDQVHTFNDVLTLGSVSMRSYRFG
jgi:4,5-DOPA dioxygenase extradiol